MNWSFFERRVCLTTIPEEWTRGLIEFNRVGLEVEKFQSIADIGPHQSFSHSVRRILIDFLYSGARTLLHVEDDCTFRDLSYLPTALAQLPDDWDIVYLGANLILWGDGTVAPPERYSDHLFRVYGAWTTHAIGFNRKVVPFILEHQVGYSEQMIDNWLSQQLPGLKAYVVAPMVAYQRPRISSIWGKGTVDDYTPIFEASDARLR